MNDLSTSENSTIAQGIRHDALQLIQTARKCADESVARELELIAVRLLHTATEIERDGKGFLYLTTPEK